MKSIKIFKSELMDAFETELASVDTEVIMKQSAKSFCTKFGFEYDDEHDTTVYYGGVHSLFNSMLSIMDDHLVDKKVSMGAFWGGLFSALATIYEATTDKIINDEVTQKLVGEEVLMLNSISFHAFVLIMNKVYERLELLDATNLGLQYVNDVDGKEYHDI